MPIDYKGALVVSFESRQAAKMAELIEASGGVAMVAPSVREMPLEQNVEALEFAKLLFAGWVDMLILTTGVGTRLLVEAICVSHPRKKVLEALGSTAIVALGTKPAAALHELGLKSAVLVPKPHTSADLLEALDRKVSIEGKRVAVQEYGQSDPELVASLEDRGAQVLRVPVYRWGLPEDLTPLRRAIQAMISGAPKPVDFALFTSSSQVRHLFDVARMDGQEEALTEALRTIFVGSVGPVATRTLLQHGITADYEPDTPQMAHLVRETARRGADLLLKKRVARRAGLDTHRWRRIDMVWPVESQSPDAVPSAAGSVFMKACRRQQVPYTPVWVMRQAGRYQREYLRIRKQVSMLELCKTPELAAEVTLMAVDRLGVDAAIIFADILLVTEPMGLQLEFAKGEGPVIHNPVRTLKDAQGLRRPDAQELAYVYKAIDITRRALRPDIGLIGFAGAPFTIASYMVEGGKSSHYIKTKTMMYEDQETWNVLMARLTDLLIEYLNGQIAAGADAVQLFDSWVGSLSPDDYRQFVMPHVKRLIAGIDKAAPVINFSTGNPALLPLMKEAGGDIIGLDWRADLAEAWAILGDDVGVMGNLDPIVLYTSPREIRAHVKRILAKAGNRPGHIFNLGHGILPDMPPENVAELVDAVHELSAR